MKYENAFVLLISLCVHLVDCEFYMCTIGINSTDNLAKCGVPLLSSWLRSFQPIFETSSLLWDCNSLCINCHVSWGLYDSLDVLYRNWMVKRFFCGWSGLGKGSLRNREIRVKDTYSLRKYIQCQYLKMCTRRLANSTKDLKFSFTFVFLLVQIWKQNLGSKTLENETSRMYEGDCCRKNKSNVKCLQPKSFMKVQLKFLSNCIIASIQFSRSAFFGGISVSLTSLFLIVLSCNIKYMCLPHHVPEALPALLSSVHIPVLLPPWLQPCELRTTSCWIFISK